MNSDVEKFIKGESKNSYNYFGAHKVNDGACFRIYTPHAKEVEVVVNGNNYKMDKIDFRGVFETRVKDIKEFDSYYYEILSSNNTWVNKNDPYTFYHDSNKSVFIDTDQYIFSDQKWINKDKDTNYFNACLLDDTFKMDDQREIIKNLKDLNYNYVILRPYNSKYLYCINECFINESSLKNFINNLHEANIGVIFDFDTSCFFDYNEGLNDFDGQAIYNKENDKYKDIDLVYFDFNKNHTKSYVQSFINYYVEVFHGDGLYLDDSEFNHSLANEYNEKVVVYKGNTNINGYASCDYLDKIIDNLNSGFDCKKFVNTNIEDNSYLIYDYAHCIDKISGNENHKKEVAKMLLAIAYVSNCYLISKYNDDKQYLKELAIVSDLYKNSKSLYNNATKSLLLDGKKNNYFAYQFYYRNEYIILFINFSELEDAKFDLGMPYYGYYNLILDTTTNEGGKEPSITRSKKIKDKTLAMRMDVKPYQVLVYKRMKDI